MSRSPPRSTEVAVWLALAVGAAYLLQTDVRAGMIAIALAGAAEWVRIRPRGRPWERWDGAAPGAASQPRRSLAWVALLAVALPAWGWVSKALGRGAPVYLELGIAGAPLIVLVAAWILFGTQCLLVIAARAWSAAADAMRALTRPRQLVIEPDRIGTVQGAWVQWWPLAEIMHIRSPWTGIGAPDVTVWDGRGRCGRWIAGAQCADLDPFDAIRAIREAIIADLVPRLVSRLERGDTLSIGGRWSWSAAIGLLLALDVARSVVASLARWPDVVSRLFRWAEVEVVVAVACLGWAAIEQGRRVVVAAGGVRSLAGGPEVPWTEIHGARLDAGGIVILGSVRRFPIDSRLTDAVIVPAIVAAMRRTTHPASAHTLEAPA